MSITAATIRTLGQNMKKRVVNEMKILEQLHHRNIISFYGSWLNKQSECVVFITEMITSGLGNCHFFSMYLAVNSIDVVSLRSRVRAALGRVCGQGAKRAGGG